MPSIEQTFTLQVPSSTINLAMIREFVARVGGMAGFGENDVAKLELAVDEACANVIEHAYGSDSTKQVSVRATFDDEQMQIEIIDRGRGFDPSSVPQQELDQLIAQRRSGGLGLRLIRTIMDDVQYQIVPGEKNELRMVKKIRKP